MRIKLKSLGWALGAQGAEVGVTLGRKEVG